MDARLNTGGMQGMIEATRAYTANTLMFNFRAMPAISVPYGLVNGLSVVIQVVGMPDSDARLFQIAHAFTAHFPQRRRPPTS